MERRFTKITKISLNKYLEGFFGFSFTFFNDSNSIVASIKQQKDFQPDLVLTLSKGASFRPHHALLKLPELHDKWMAYVHDPFPFHFYPRPYNWIQPGYAQKEKFFDQVSQKAKYSAFPSQLLMEWMGSYFPNFLNTGIVIPHQLEKIELKDVQLPVYFDQNKFTLLHAGNLMKQRSPFKLINAYKKFLTKYPEAKHDAQLLLIGPCSYHAKELKKISEELKSLVVDDRNIPFEEVLLLQHQVSVNIILESKSEISPFLPGKFPHCVEANKPILLLGPFYSETRRLLGNDYPYWSEVDNVDEIFYHICSLYQTWLLAKDSLVLERKDLLEYCSENYLKEKFENILTKR